MPALRSADRSTAIPARLLHAAWPLVAGLVATLALLTYLKQIGPLPGERWALARWPPWPPRPRPISEVATATDLAGTPLLSSITVLATLWLVGRGMGWRAVLFVVVACAGVAFNGLLKVLIGPTPLWVEARGGASAGDNFPSGHVVYATVLVGALGVLAWERRRLDLVFFAAIVVIVMGPMRVLQSVHLPSDVIAGYLVGAGWLVMAVRLTGRGRRDDAGSGRAVGTLGD